tara:strand:- start:9658 stop:11247 length:1590 start_codon:yes stop_codon:yes gene_type:complete
MADFVAVIRKAVDNLPENTPENRTKVYTKARAAIRRQLEAINPPPSDEAIARQLDKLDMAIEEVEAEHAEALPADADEADALMAELESMVEKSPVITEPRQPAFTPPPFAPSAPAPRPAAPQPAFQPAPVPAPAPVEMRREPEAFGEPDRAPAAPAPHHADLVGDAHDEAFGLSHEPRPAERPARARRQGPGRNLVAAVILILVLGAIAFAGWTYKDTLTAMMASPAIDTPVVEETAQPAEETAVLPATEPDPATLPATDEPVEPATETALVAPDDGKFNQRLNPDGTEVDAGPAPGPAADDTVEGRSVAELTDAGAQDETAAEEATADAPVAPEDAAAPSAQPLGVAQKMILYEERLGQQSLEVKPGTVVWSLVSEPSGDGPDEQVIRGEINNPDKGLSALITIKRNTDPSLPASHIVEVVFALPPEFDGGSIDQLQRIAMKQTEADQGNPLIAVPAKITQDFYMVALNDLAEAREANTNLLRERNWIDIPVVYANGRQALITLEKGASGTEVFNQALDAWARAEPAQ